MAQGLIHYRNDTGAIVRGRNGAEIRPGADFWTSEYEPSEYELTILEDNMPPVIPAVSMDVGLTGTPHEILVPSPKHHPHLMEVCVQIISDGAECLLRFNKNNAPSAPVDGFTTYAERVDTRLVRSLFVSGSGVARVIFKEVIYNE
jgi:hypothetical protein